LYLFFADIGPFLFSKGIIGLKMMKLEDKNIEWILILNNIFFQTGYSGSIRIILALKEKFGFY